MSEEYGYFKLGRITFSLYGTCRVSQELKTEFSSIKIFPTAETKSLLSIFMVSELPVLDGSVFAENMTASDTAVLIRHSEYDYVFQEKSGIYYLYVQVKPAIGKKKYIPSVVLRAREMSNLNRDQVTSKNIIYNCLDYIFQNLNLRVGQSFVHASSISADNEASLFCAWGGIGKTTTILRAIKERQSNYLSDDLAIVDEDGAVYRNPKAPQIYAYNCIGDPWLKQRLLKGRSLADKLMWRFRLSIFGANSVRRRVQPEALFDIVENELKAVVSKVFYLERYGESEFEVSDISANEAAAKAASVLMYELSPVVKVIGFYKSSFPEGGLFFNFVEMQNRSEDILFSAFSRAKLCKKVKIPTDALPKNLFQRLDDEEAF